MTLTFHIYSTDMTFAGKIDNTYLMVVTNIFCILYYYFYIFTYLHIYHIQVIFEDFYEVVVIPPDCHICSAFAVKLKLCNRYWLALHI